MWQAGSPPARAAMPLGAGACRQVDTNQLTGSIPSSWGRMHNLYTVNVTNNAGLCGMVPDSMAGVLQPDLSNTTNLNTHCPWTDDGALPAC